MIKNYILETLENQKIELEVLKNKPYVKRDMDNKSDYLLSQDLIKVILGPRRSGKSRFAINMIKDIECAYINFDNQVLTSDISHTEIMDSIKKVYGDISYYFFDEIQNLDKWEYLVNELHRKGKNVIVTGSNSKLLSKELSTALTGRHIPVYIYPFTYKEFLDIRGVGRGSVSLGEYIKIGGFPEPVLKGVSSDYLNTLLDSLILRDIVDRYKVRNTEDLQKLADYILSSPAMPATFNSLQKVLKIKSTNTVKKYLNFIEEVFAIISLKRFSLKIKERENSYIKIYPIDNGYIEAKKQTMTPDIGKSHETFIAIELYKRCMVNNLELFYYKTRNDKEVDFIIKKNSKIIELIQVCENLHMDNYKRELSALVEASIELSCPKKTCYISNMSVDLKSDFSDIEFKSIYNI